MNIWICGSSGMVGSAIFSSLSIHTNHNLFVTTRSEVDFLKADQINSFIQENNIEFVIVAAAKVGGILANQTYPVDFMVENLKIELNIIEQSFLCGIKRLIFLGSSCIYPKNFDNKIRENDLLTGPLEETNQWYAIAKIAGIKLCQAYNKQFGTNYLSLQPCNLYGPNDNFDLMTSHVLPALIRKAHEAKLNSDKYFQVWGSGKPLREFLYVEDLAHAITFLLSNFPDKDIINVGSNSEVTIKNLSKLVSKIIGYDGEIKFDHSKPDGVLRKKLDTSLLENMGWQPTTTLEEGITKTYKWFLDHH